MPHEPARPFVMFSVLVFCRPSPAVRLPACSLAFAPSFCLPASPPRAACPPALAAFGLSVSRPLLHSSLDKDIPRTVCASLKIWVSAGMSSPWRLVLFFQGRTVIVQFSVAALVAIVCSQIVCLSFLTMIANPNDF